MKEIMMPQKDSDIISECNVGTVENCCPGSV